MQMLHFKVKLNEIPLLSILLLVSWALISSCSAADDRKIFTEIPSTIFVGEKTTISSGDTTNQSQNGNSTATSTVPLAAKRTRRIDPSEEYNYYEGGWDITNIHYIESLLYSGIPLYATAVIWCFCAGLGIFVLYSFYCCCCCKNKRERKYSRKAYAISLIFLIMFLIMAIAGGALLCYGQENFQTSVEGVLEHVVRKGNAVVDVVNNVLRNLAAAEKIGIANYSLPEDFKQSIEQLFKFSGKTVNLPKIQAEIITSKADQLLDVVSRGFLAVPAAMLVLAVVGFIMSFCGWRLAVYFLLLFGWLLVTITFAVCGVSVTVENAIGDTCVAMEDWHQHPQNNTALSKLLPCMEEETAVKALKITRSTTFQMFNLINTFISNVANKNVPPDLKELYYNQSGPLMPFLCNPFYPNLTERACANTEVQLKNAPQAYKEFVCSTSPSGICTAKGRITPDYYDQMMVAINMSDSLSRDSQFLIGLGDCSFVAETFDEISKQDCPLLMQYSKDVNNGFLLLAVAVVFSLIMWVIFVRERQLHISSKNFKKTHVWV